LCCDVPACGSTRRSRSPTPTRRARTRRCPSRRRSPTPSPPAGRTAKTFPATFCSNSRTTSATSASTETRTPRTSAKSIRIPTSAIRCPTTRAGCATTHCSRSRSRAPSRWEGSTGWWWTSPRLPAPRARAAPSTRRPRAPFLSSSAAAVRQPASRHPGHARVEGAPLPAALPGQRRDRDQPRRRQPGRVPAEGQADPSVPAVRQVAHRRPAR
jgi:hypothetical protein